MNPLPPDPALELDEQEIRRLGHQVADFVSQYLAGLSGGRILPEDLTPSGLRRIFAEPLPRQSQGLDAALEDFVQKIAANSARVGHPRFMGWIRPSPLAVPVLAEALAAALNQSVAVWDGAPAATEVELRVIAWLKEMTGYAPQAGGLLTSGGSMANFICLLAARTAADPEVRQSGLSGKPPFVLYITQETHYCVLKAAEMMGLGRRYVRQVPVDGDLRMEPDALADMAAADRQAGLRPLAAVATLGTVNTGACDDLVALGEVCRQAGLWLHVDGAYGGLAGLAPEKRHLAAGLELADSLAFDPHKTLFVPFEAGCALVREAAHLRQSFGVQSDYLPNTEMDEDCFGCGEAPFHFRDYGPQLTRSFRALKIYLTLKVYGVDALAAAVSRQYALAGLLAQRLQADPAFELLAPAELGIVAFRYIAQPPDGVPDPQAWLDEFNRRIVVELQRGGQIFLAGTRVHGKYALRACFVSHRTSEQDVGILLAEVRKAAEKLGA